MGPLCIREKFLNIPKNKNQKRLGRDAPLMTNRLRKCGVYTQWNFTQP
jgi:hypothetical protein